MDIKLFNTKKNKFEKLEVIEIDNNTISNILKLNIVKENYYINKDNNDYIKLLFIDENNRIGILEKRMDKFEPLIKEGLNHIDYIRKHLSEFKMLVSDNYQGDLNSVIYDPYLMVISSFINKNDYNAISHLPYDIELYTLNAYKNEYIINKAYVSRKMNFNGFNATLNKDSEMLVKKIIDYTLSLSEEVFLYGYKNIMIFTRMFSFLKIEIIDGKISLYIKKKDKWMIEKNIDINKLYQSIEVSFDQN